MSVYKQIRGELFGRLGPSGAGKQRLLTIFKTRQLEADSGEVYGECWK